MSDQSNQTDSEQESSTEGTESAENESGSNTFEFVGEFLPYQQESLASEDGGERKHEDETDEDGLW